MFAVRFIVLALWASYAWSMGQIPAEGLNAFGKFMATTFFLAAPTLYFLPTIEARLRQHANLAAIALVNAFLGWTAIGWVVSLVWAFKKPEAPQPPAPAALKEAPPVASDARPTKLCPFCAEPVQAAAIKCKHCGSALNAAGTP